MKYCPICGSELDNDTGRCPECSYNVVAARVFKIKILIGMDLMFIAAFSAILFLIP